LDWERPAATLPGALISTMVRDTGELHKRLEESRRLLLDVIGQPGDFTVLRSWGNRGDELIFAGMRRLLRDLSYREYDIRLLDRVPAGGLAVISGGGSWCRPFHAMPELLSAVELSFRRVIVFPSSFDIEEPAVRQVLEKTRAVVFARERESYERIRGLCDVRLAHDTAFFFDFEPYRSRFQQGVLHAFRRDAEAAGGALPEDNRDISEECQSLDEWLWTISRHRLIRTDRAHVVIAGAMLDKQIEYRPSSYHKVPAIVDFCIPQNLITTLRVGDGLGPAVEPARLRTGDSGWTPTEVKLQASHHALEAIRKSWSWRLTAPLRAMLDGARAVKGFVAGDRRPEPRA